MFGCGLVMASHSRRAKAFAFSLLLLLQSDQAVCFPRYDVDIFHTRDCHKPKRWRSSSSAMASQICMAFASSPALWRDVLRLKLKRRFWCAPRRAGFWESEVCGTWQEVGRRYPDWEDAQYVAYFRNAEGCVSHCLWLVRTFSS